MAQEAPDLGFVGLGLMGQAFTKRLVATGHRVTGYDIAAEKLARGALEEAGVTAVAIGG